MGRVVVLGSGDEMERYRLAGAEVVVAEDPVAAVDAWDGRPTDVSLVILTPAAASAIRPVGRPGDPLTVMVPQ